MSDEDIHMMIYMNVMYKNTLSLITFFNFLFILTLRLNLTNQISEERRYIMQTYYSYIRLLKKAFEAYK